MQDAELLRAYLTGKTEAAFDELVGRYVDLVFSAALRQLEDRALAQEASQAVFCLLARKARGLTHYRTLAGWLYRTTSYTAAKIKRGEQRRRQREREAAAMNEPAPQHEELWNRLAPQLDAALTRLGEADRLVILLRFFQAKSMREVGDNLGINEDAAKMRVSRAVERLRRLLAARGTVCTAAALGGVLSARAVEAAPAAAARGITQALAAASPSGFSSVPIVQTLLLMTKFKTAALIVTAAGLLALVGNRAYFQPATELGPDSQVGAPSVHGGAALPAKSPPEWLAEIRRRHPTGTDLARAMAKLRRALLDPPTNLSGTRQYPSKEMFDALSELGGNAGAAFTTLRDAALNPEKEIRLRAVSALGTLLSLAPGSRAEVVPFLHQLAFHSQDPELSSFAVTALRARDDSGTRNFLSAEDLGPMTDLLARTDFSSLKRYLPEALSDTILQDRPAAEPFLPALQKLLDGDNPDLRFEAACALVQAKGADDPKIFDEIKAGLKSGDSMKGLMAIETLQRLGPIAADSTGVLLEFANATQDPLLRSLALSAAGKIDGQLRAALPAVDQALTQEEASTEAMNRWSQKWQSGNYTVDDLLTALKDPVQVGTAAPLLGKLGPAAAQATSALTAAIAGQDDMTRDKIVDALHQIDPTIVISKVARDTVAQGLSAELGAVLEAAGNRPAGGPDLETDFQTRFFKGISHWYTRDEVADMSKQMAALDPAIQSAFAARVVQVDPNLKDLFKP